MPIRRMLSQTISRLPINTRVAKMDNIEVAIANSMARHMSKEKFEGVKKSVYVIFGSGCRSRAKAILESLLIYEVMYCP